jgi:hypothetical protein
LFTVSTGAFILKCSLYVCSSLQPLPGLAQHAGFGKLKNLSNQVVLCVPRIHTHYDNLKVARNAPLEVIRAGMQDDVIEILPKQKSR